MIPIQNIYHMLSYAFQVLNEQGYKKIATENFNNVADLCSAILSKGIAIQIKRGLGREYTEITEPLTSLRGRIEITESIKTRTMLRNQMICSYDDFSVNSYMNQILKTTMIFLLSADIPDIRKKELRKLLMFFGDVEILDIHTINWSVQYNRTNQTYRMLISVCYLVVKGLLQSQKDGTVWTMDFFDEQRMHRLYEKFIFEYYRKEFPEISVGAPYIPWAVDDGILNMLPSMKSDVVLRYKNRVLIIDAKYYAQTTQSNWDIKKIHSGNLYQIFTYVKNMDAKLSEIPCEVSGMLLYAKTDEKVQPNNKYQMSGNKIVVQTLDLNCDFAQISAQLDKIVEEVFLINKGK